MSAVIEVVRSTMGDVGSYADTDTPFVFHEAGRRDLLQLFAELQFTRGAEIGVWSGKFSQQLLDAIPKLHLHAVDPWQSLDDYHERKNEPDRMAAAYHEAMTRLAGRRCAIFRMTSLEAAARVPDGSLDFVYIDGNHGAAHVRADLEAWSPKVRRGGVVAGHDFHTSPDRPFIEVEQVVRAWTREHHIAPWFVLAGDKAPSYFWIVP